MYLFCDTETTGLFNRDAPPEHESQPHIVQIAMSLVEPTGESRVAASLIVRPDGWTVPPDVAAIHRITTEKAQRHGVPLKVALAVFCCLRLQANFLVGHNMGGFDLTILRIAMAQGRMDERSAALLDLPMVDTMPMADEIMKLPPTERMKANGYGNKTKAPSLAEAYEFFTGQPLAGAHDAAVDVAACRKVFFAIERWHFDQLRRGTNGTG